MDFEGGKCAGEHLLLETLNDPSEKYLSEIIILINMVCFNRSSFCEGKERAEMKKEEVNIFIQILKNHYGIEEYE